MYPVLAWMARTLVHLFYRVERAGFPLLDSGPVLYVGNHSNGLVDPALLVAASPRPVRFLAKYTLFDMPVLGHIVRSLGAIPIYRRKDGVGTERNEQSFVATFDALERGEVLGLFPEGTSHSGSSLLPMKTGAARIALGAEGRAEFGLGVRIQPVGLVYDDRHRFRSRVTLWIGEPFTVDHLRELHGSDAWGAVTELTAEIGRALQGVVIEHPDEAARRRLEVLQVHMGRQGALARREGSDRLATWRLSDAQAAGELDAVLDRVVRRLAGRRPVESKAPFRPLEALAIVAGAVVFAVPYSLSWAAMRLSPLDRDKDVTVLLVAAWLVVPLWVVLIVLLGWLWLGPLIGVSAGAAAVLLGWLASRAWTRGSAPWRTGVLSAEERGAIARCLPGGLADGS